MSLLDGSGNTSHEATFAGPWRVVRHDEQRALLAAATLGSTNRPTSLLLARERDVEGRLPIVERELDRGCAKVAGWRGPGNSGPDLRAIHVAEHLLRNPRRLALLLEAAGAGVLEAAGKILARRLRDPVSRLHPPPSPPEDAPVETVVA